MIQVKLGNQFHFALKSALMLLIGSLLLGFVITRSIYIYQRYNSPLDVVEEEEVEAPLVTPQMILDESPSLEASENATQVIQDVQNYFDTQYEGDDAAIGIYLHRVPNFISIPAIGLQSEIGFANVKDVTVFGEKYQQWVAPNDIVGWHYQSAILGEPGNTVLNGHHNVFSEVFRDLFLVQKGDEIIISSEDGDYHYMVASVMILPERFESREVRLQNARWIQTSEDERVTLISCWPYESNTHRVVVVAFPIDAPAKLDRGN